MVLVGVGSQSLCAQDTEYLHNSPIFGILGRWIYTLTFRILRISAKQSVGYF